MDLLYYLSGFAIVLGLPVLCIGIIAALIRPHLVNNRKIVKNPMSRKKIASIGVSALLLSFVGFSTVLAVTEPAGVKADRMEREVAAAKEAQAQLDAKKKADNTARKLEEEKNKPSVKTETRTEVIPFEATERSDSSLPAGQKKISVAGVNGERVITYSVTYIQGKETTRTEVKNEITKSPTTQVTLNGTYVKSSSATQEVSCPNGTYVNSAGNTVCRPYESNGAPAGATARCSDGTYSFSQTRRGTCSRHGGVASWL